MTLRVMFDTNAVAAVVKARSPALENYARSRPVCISVVTEAEVLYGLARRPAATALRRVAEGLLTTVEILPWDSACAAAYGALRAQLEDQGTPLAPMDLLIAAHALAVRCPLVTSDATFTRVPGLSIVQWSAEEIREISGSASRRARTGKPQADSAEEPVANYQVSSRRSQRKPRAT